MAKGEETYQKMIDVSIYYFAKDGIQKTSFSKIAEALHMTKPSLYYYVKSKEELIQKVFDYIYEDYNFSAYFEVKSLKSKEVENYLIEGGLQYFSEIEKQDIILNLLNEFNLYANRIKLKDPSFFDKIKVTQQSFVNGFEKTLLIAGVKSDEITIRAQGLAIMLNHIQSYKKMGISVDINALWERAVQQALR